VLSVRSTIARPLAVAGCVCLLGTGAAGCSTTQEKAAAKQLESEQILKARAQRQAKKKREKQRQQHQKKEKGE